MGRLTTSRFFPLAEGLARCGRSSTEKQLTTDLAGGLVEPAHRPFCHPVVVDFAGRGHDYVPRPVVTAVELDHLFTARGPHGPLEAEDVTSERVFRVRARH